MTYTVKHCVVQNSWLISYTINNSKQAYVSERCVGEKREAFKQVLMVIVLDHRRPVSLKQKTAGLRDSAVNMFTVIISMTLYKCI